MSDYYLQFLETIDAGPHEVSDYEAQFIEDMLTRRPQQMSLKQQALVQRMAEKYLGEDI